MVEPRVLSQASQLPGAFSLAVPRPAEVRVLLADPAFFDVLYVINPHMEGNLGSVDKELARRQWAGLKAAYEQIGYPVEVVPPVDGLPDLVFMANQSFPAQLPDGRWAAIMSHMHSVQRRPEVEVVEAWYRTRDCAILPLTDGMPFEGNGDAMFVPGRRVVIGGYGFRTVKEAYPLLSSLLDVTVLTVELVDPDFYHLDTCLQLLDEHTALYVPEAFTDEGRALLQAAFPRLLRAPYDEADELLSCNGHCPDRKHFIAHHACVETNRIVRDAGFEIIEVDTSEFLKSGGSVFCMKMMLP